MEVFIAIARYWDLEAVIGVFPTEVAAQKAIEEVQTWEDEGGLVYGDWSFHVLRTELGALMVAHPDEG